MGITISYRGTLDDPKLLDQLVVDVKQRCQKLGWPCVDVDKRIVGHAYRMVDQGLEEERPGLATGRVALVEVPVDDRIRGVMVHPPKTETLVLTFNREGRIIYYQPLPGRMLPPEEELPPNLPIIMPPRFTQEPGYYFEEPMGLVKTTGQVEAHIEIVGILRHIKEHYVSDLKVSDSGEYWETGNVAKLIRAHATMEAMIGIFSRPENTKKLLESMGFEGIEKVEPLDPELKSETPEHMKDWGISAHEN